MKILIVDDIEENSYLLESLLKGSNYEVVTAKDGIEALDKLKEEPISMIISDILMPRMDGFRLCRECKKDKSLKKIPFVFYTASYTEKKDEDFALSLGAEKFIIKPQEPEVFLKILKEIIEKKKKRVLVTPKESIKEEEIYLTLYNSRLIQKLEKKMLELEKMNKRLQEKEDKIYSLNQFQENVIHNANIWISVLDEKANIIIWNEAAEKMSGYSAKEVMGHHKIWEWLYPDENYRKDIITKAADAVFNKGEAVEEYETKICCKDGKVRIISWNYNNITNPQGKTIGSVALGRDITEHKQAEERLKKIMDATLKAISKIVETKDPYTSGHQRQVSQLAISIAREMDLSPDQREGIRIASLIHDIGKISIPTEILSKPSKLSNLEFSLIKEHAQIGYGILQSIDFSYPVAQIVLQHHERLNGSGYPQGLKGKDILIEACIIGVADVVEAMSSYRPYRAALGIDAALEEISINRGILYAPEVVAACIKLFKEKDFKF